MKALTIWQPWASLIVARAKPYEFRGWKFPASLIGERIAIHAGARKVRPVEIDDLIARLRSSNAWSTCLRPHIALPLLEAWRDHPERLPLSSVIGTAILGEPRSGWDIAEEFGGVINDSDRQEHANWAWPLSSVGPMEPFLPARGAQGFWEWRP